MISTCSRYYWGKRGVFATIFSKYLCYVEELGTLGLPSEECTCGTGSEGDSYGNKDCGAKIHTVLASMRKRMSVGNQSDQQQGRGFDPPPSYVCDPPYTGQAGADCFCTADENQERMDVNLQKLRGAEGIVGGCSEGLMWCALARLHKSDPTDTQSNSSDTTDCKTGCPINSDPYIQDLLFGEDFGSASHLNITLQAMPKLQLQITDFINETKQALINYDKCRIGQAESSTIPKPGTTFSRGTEFNP